MLEQVDMKKLKKLKKGERHEKIAEYHEKKTLLIQEYIAIQDILDAYNEKIYGLSCEIEQINLILKELEKKK